MPAGSLGPSGKGPETPIPDKLYFKIGEVSQLVGVPSHVLRYWEKEVPALRPGKSVSNQRRYRRRDVEIFRQIRRLLYEERYTLAGARRRLSSPDAIREDERAIAADVDAVGSPETDLPEAPAPQLNLGFARRNDLDRTTRLRDGLLELIQLAGEEP